jgi:hypothetical protein
MEKAVRLPGWLDIPPTMNDALEGANITKALVNQVHS